MQLSQQARRFCDARKYSMALLLLLLIQCGTWLMEMLLWLIRTVMLLIQGDG